MTREEAKAKLEDVAKNMLWGCGEYSEALDMAIKALEQETVSKESYDHEYFLRKEFEIKITRLEQTLDKIRAEIESKLDNINRLYNQDNQCDYDDGAIDSLGYALQIIDKYKAEQEET